MGKQEMVQWMPEDDVRLMELVKQHGPQWNLIDKSFPTRTVASVRNRYLRMNYKGITKNKCKLCGQLKRGHICPKKMNTVITPSREPSPAVIAPHADVTVDMPKISQDAFEDFTAPPVQNSSLSAPSYRSLSEPAYRSLSEPAYRSLSEPAYRSLSGPGPALVPHPPDEASSRQGVGQGYSHLTSAPEPHRDALAHSGLASCSVGVELRTIDAELKTTLDEIVGPAMLSSEHWVGSDAVTTTTCGTDAQTPVAPLAIEDKSARVTEQDASRYSSHMVARAPPVPASPVPATEREWSGREDGTVYAIDQTRIDDDIDQTRIDYNSSAVTLASLCYADANMAAVEPLATETTAAESNSNEDDSCDHEDDSSSPEGDMMRPAAGRKASRAWRGQKDWSPEEDEILKKQVAIDIRPPWKKITMEHFPDRSWSSVRCRWQRLVKPEECTKKTSGGPIQSSFLESKVDEATLPQVVRDKLGDITSSGIFKCDDGSVTITIKIPAVGQQDGHRNTEKLGAALLSAMTKDLDPIRIRTIQGKDQVRALMTL